MRIANSPTTVSVPAAEPPRTGAATPVSDAPDMRRQELAAFLRSRRERISPEQVGLPNTGRRRTPGLRREEVAQLAAVGVTWYTWLEQGRDIQVSGQVLEAVSRALLLDPNEREHLYILAGAGNPTPSKDCPVITPAVRQMLDQMTLLPSWVLNSRYDILAYNAMCVRLLGDFGQLPPEERNVVWLIFTNPAYQSRWLDLEAAQQQVVGRMRGAMADHVADPAWKALVARLRQASPEFEERWQRHEVLGRGNGNKGFLHPEVGVLRMDYTNMWFGPREGTRLVVYSPSDEEGRVKLEQLAGD
ncbi:helix-turn-helix transcriptional regulator [Kitasatospora sp. NBC_01250]|uniref:helix-turn-helix transcriptional regulator n=1 Tax=Kitasatospora sp. NBC_01250 TaxID=2903571 RepID=UPI003FA5BDC6